MASLEFGLTMTIEQFLEDELPESISLSGVNRLFQSRVIASHFDILGELIVLPINMTSKVHLEKPRIEVQKRIFYVSLPLFRKEQLTSR